MPTLYMPANAICEAKDCAMSVSHCTDAVQCPFETQAIILAEGVSIVVGAICNDRCNGVLNAKSAVT